MEDNDTSMHSSPAKPAVAPPTETIGSSPPTRMALSSDHAKHPQSERSTRAEDHVATTSDAIEPSPSDTEDIETRLAALESSMQVELEKRDQLIESHRLRIEKLEREKRERELEVKRLKKRYGGGPGPDSDDAPARDVDEEEMAGMLDGMEVDNEPA